MTRRSWIESLVMQVQGEFLDGRAVTLTAAEAEGRFGIDRGTSEAVLNALAEARVLTRTRSGEYARLFPRLARAA